MKLENGASQGQATMLLRIDGLDQAAMSSATSPVVTDLKVPDPPPAEVIFTSKEMRRSASGRTWLLSAIVNGLTGNTSQQRYLSISFAGVEKTLDYTLTNKYEAAFSWTLKPPPSAISIKPGQPIEIGIAVGPVPASDVTLLQATLVEQSRKSLLASTALTLCRDPDGKSCRGGIDLPASSANRLWLRTEGSEAVGQFVGTVMIAASQKSGGDLVTLTVYVTTTCSQLLGVFLIFVGLIMAWAISVYGRSRLSRDELLHPAAFVSQKLRNLRTTLQQVTPAKLVEHTVHTSRKARRTTQGAF
jgi:hypothetical protein